MRQVSLDPGSTVTSNPTLNETISSTSRSKYTATPSYPTSTNFSFTPTLIPAGHAKSVGPMVGIVVGALTGLAALALGVGSIVRRKKRLGAVAKRREVAARGVSLPPESELKARPPPPDGAPPSSTDRSLPGEKTASPHGSQQLSTSVPNPPEC
ncbi:hypothetical protein FGG08_003848 [Glutinoglossum americanum]|uniref:Uncharacterized protein n=1 Tax=Glutinoglossum americanum TaxID=1670608 RepID=A0A9P8I1T3_9PEZI|nr:hypothetical protein FGG08_003848 [Glutinoglossum americanum]